MNKTKPILFSTQMVHAILEGRKTMTRRVVKPQPKHFLSRDARNREPIAVWIDNEKWVKPRYQVGDVLWVRETWQDLSDNEGEYVYFAEGNKGLSDRGWGALTLNNIKWRPSIHMPKEAARIFLRVTNVRVERVQDISFDDALKEGFDKRWYVYNGLSFPASEEEFNLRQYPERGFKRYWNELNEKRGYGWDTNPWVWVIEFERISKEEALRLEGLK